MLLHGHTLVARKMNISPWFSVAAINDSNPFHPHSEVLPPSKEAQEAHLTHLYHDALVELQGGNLLRAQSIFQCILQDPIVLNAQKEDATDSGDDNPLLQLRFSTLKNLAGTLCKLGSEFHKEALECYIQAASIDQDDAVLWNRLGTLACSLGHFNISRAAFEQGLFCSPRNWLCMEKLAEVLIAIGDEDACSSVVKRLLKLSPSHPRAKYIYDVLEGHIDSRGILKARGMFCDSLFNKLKVLPRGLDLLEPQHRKMPFPKKRLLDEEEEDEGSSKKGKVQTLHAILPEASWFSVLNYILKHLENVTVNETVDDAHALCPLKERVREDMVHPPLVNASISFSIQRGDPISAEILCVKEELSTGNRRIPSPDKHKSINAQCNGAYASADRQCRKINSISPSALREVVIGNLQAVDALEKLQAEERHSEDMSNSVDSSIKKDQVPADVAKIGDILYEDEAPYQERRSTRLERIRTRRHDKDDEIFLDRNKAIMLSKELRQLLVKFISGHNQTRREGKAIDQRKGSVNLQHSREHSIDISTSNSGSQNMQIMMLQEEMNDVDEEKQVKIFIEEHSINSGVLDVGHDLLERVAASGHRHQAIISRLMSLDRHTRLWGRASRSTNCSLFLAELYMDRIAQAPQEEDTSLYASECNYHLCRVLENAAIHAELVEDQSTNNSDEMKVGRNSTSSADPPGHTAESKSNSKITQCEDSVGLGEASYCVVQDQSTSESAIKTPELCINVINKYSVSEWPLWARYHWLSGRLGIYSSNQEKGYQEFKRCLAIIDTRTQLKNVPACILLPHCKVDNTITSKNVQLKIYELEMDKLLKQSAAGMCEQGKYAELIELLVPVLLSDKDKEKRRLGREEFKKYGVDTSPEFRGLSMLKCAAENVTPANFGLVLQCYAQRLEILCHAVTSNEVRDEPSILNSPGPEAGASPTLIFEEERGKNYDVSKLVAEEVKCLSRCATSIKETFEALGLDAQTMEVAFLQRLQWHLVDLMCYYIKMNSMGKDVGLSTPGCHVQLGSSFFVDAAVAFCKLQHLDPTASIKQQVELLVTVHDVLALRGLCCAGKGCEGGDGAFLKMAIKHLGSVELKLRLLCEQQNSSKITGVNLKGLHARLASGDKDDNDRSPERLSENADECREDSAVFDGGKRKRKQVKSLKDEAADEVEKKRIELGLDYALDQSFYCLYGLNLRSGFDSMSHDGLSEHKNTNRGDYETKEQCAGVFQYVLPYAKACTRGRLLKLRKVLRAVHKQFPNPPPEVLAQNSVDVFIEDVDFEEEKIYDMVMSGTSLIEIMRCALGTNHSVSRIVEVSDLNQGQPCGQFERTLLTGGSVQYASGDSTSLRQHALGPSSGMPVQSNCGTSLVDSISDPDDAYLEVHENLYYLLSEVEDISASDKWAGFVLTKEGEDFVEQNSNLIKHDLCYNACRFESWQKLARLYDEEVDLLLNDGSKNINATDWKKNVELTSRVEASRRRTRRCLLMSLALAKTPEQQSDIHELLALVYYDSLQNVAPSYDQRYHIPQKNAAWKSLCEKAFRHFEGAFSLRPHWTHVFYLGKLCEKLCRPSAEALAYYKRAADMQSSAVDPLYRLHASRLKLLCASDHKDISILQVLSQHCFISSNTEKMCILLGSLHDSTVMHVDKEEHVTGTTVEVNSKCRAVSLDQQELIVKAKRQLFEDCSAAMKACFEGDMKHFHKARFRLAHGLGSSLESQNLEQAKEELSFCFRSTRSLFTINMWEIDGSLRKSRRRANHTLLDIGISESSRKFITCVRKYLLFYLTLCEKTGDLSTLERAFSSLKVDKKFSLCLEDIGRFALGKYIQTLAKAISQSETDETSSNNSLSSLSEKLFNLFMDLGTSWSECVEASLFEAQSSGGPVMSESVIHGSILRYLSLLESEMRVDSLEVLNERLRKRFKNPKILDTQTAQICKHASLAWCRALCFSLSSITPPHQPESQAVVNIDRKHCRLFVNLQEDVMMASSIDLQVSLEGSGQIPSAVLSSEKKTIDSTPASSSSSNPSPAYMKSIPVRQASIENLEKATSLLRGAYVFYREGSGPFPSGINLFLTQPGDPCEAIINVAATTPEVLDISIPRKLLLWAFTLVHGWTSNVAEAVKYCEDQAKPKQKKGLVNGLLSPGPTIPLSSSQEKIPGGFQNLLSSVRKQQPSSCCTGGNEIKKLEGSCSDFSGNHVV